ncbi:hypothetical protein CLOP_g24690 [Closterium sp. NIES-67]|nr:hypothetical protein CLOP_g24690 [Closterium sp. NIES-67]
MSIKDIGFLRKARPRRVSQDLRSSRRRSLRKVERRRMGLTPAQCRKVKEVGYSSTGKLATEAPVNGGRNYNGPKVAKFLVG